MAAEMPRSLGPSPARRDALTWRIRFLVGATIAYDVIQAIVARIAAVFFTLTDRVTVDSSAL